MPGTGRSGPGLSWPDGDVGGAERGLGGGGGAASPPGPPWVARVFGLCSGAG
jgi:hypothetical protein